MSAGVEQMVAEGRVDRQLALVREHWSAVRHLWLGEADPLRAARLDGLPPDFWFGAGMPGLATISVARCDTFEFAEGGRPAIIVPAYDCIPGMLDANPELHVEELRDLIAVDLDHPDRFWRRRGDAVVLGTAFLEIAGETCAPVPVFRTPISWLRAAGAGICILDWNYAKDLLIDRELIAEDVEIGTCLEAALAPSILVMEAA